VQPWIASLSECLGRGVLLLCDYGLPRRHYYHRERASGTLRCHFKQRAHADPYINVGVQDITAWVDFTRIAEAALAANLTLSGFATQAGFLLAAGLEGLVAEADDGAQRARLAGEARRLVLPEEMARRSNSWRSRAATTQRSAALRCRICATCCEPEAVLRVLGNGYNTPPIHAGPP